MESPPRPDRWVLRARASRAPRLRLFCLPFAGGGASAFMPWAKLLPEELELCGVQLPGREDRLAEPPVRRMEPLVDALAEALRPWVSQPYALFGYSMGALIAYEVTRRLAREGLPGPVHLLVAASRPPHAPPPLGSLSLADDGALVEEMRRHYGADLAPLRDNPELRAVALPILRADLELLEHYVPQPGPPLTCPLTALGGVEDGLLPHRVLVEWGRYTRGPFRPRLFSGGHFFLREKRDLLLATVAEALRFGPPAA